MINLFLSVPRIYFETTRFSRFQAIWRKILLKTKYWWVSSSKKCFKDWKNVLLFVLAWAVVDSYSFLGDRITFQKNITRKVINKIELYKNSVFFQSDLLKIFGHTMHTVSYYRAKLYSRTTTFFFMSRRENKWTFGNTPL